MPWRHRNRRINKLIKNEDANDTVTLMSKEQQVANSVSKIKSEASPGAYSGRGDTSYCHCYSVTPIVIPKEIREKKYISQSDDAAAPTAEQDQEIIRASQFAAVKDFELQVISKVKAACKLAKTTSLEEAKRIKQLEDAIASFQKSLAQLKSYQRNINDLASKNGPNAVIPRGRGVVNGQRVYYGNIYGNYCGMTAVSAQKQVSKDIDEVQMNINNTQATINRMNGISDPELNEKAVEKLNMVKTDLAKLEHLQAIVDASSSVYQTMKSFDSYYDADDRCATTCQVYCQQACQNSCQNNNTCHNQHCGGF